FAEQPERKIHREVFTQLNFYIFLCVSSCTAKAAVATGADRCHSNHDRGISRSHGKSVTFSCHSLAAAEVPAGIVRAPPDIDLLKTPLSGHRH
ncbi:hypothetical protein GBF38_005916, partial [Nibea albiflora]